MDWRSYLAVGLVVAVVTAVVAHKLAVRRDRETARRNAAVRFRAAFMSALSGLYPLPTSWPADKDIDRVLRGVFPTLQGAVAEFRPFVPFWRRWLFDRAWFKYRCGTGRRIDLQNYHHYTEFGSNPNAKENLRRNVAALLSFATILILLLATSVVIVGCNTQQSRMESSLNAYLGRSVAVFVADHGDPTSTVKLSDNESAFRWVITGQGVGAVIPMGGSLIVAPPTQRVCTVSLRATTQSPSPELKDWIIQSWNWQGAC
jgi:hypothetical protein